jgi:hypothetical protein
MHLHAYNLESDTLKTLDNFSNKTTLYSIWLEDYESSFILWVHSKNNSYVVIIATIVAKKADFAKSLI